jgi:hypothetical protein
MVCIVYKMDGSVEHLNGFLYLFGVDIFSVIIFHGNILQYVRDMVVMYCNILQYAFTIS